MSSLESLKNNQKQALSVGIILVIAAFLRIYQLGQECMWVDEVSSMDQALRPLPELFSGFVRAPLYYFLLRCWIKLFGFSEFSLRFPSAVFGIAGVYLTYRLGKAIFNRFVGLTGALLLAISSFHVFFSQEVRHYSLWVFLTLLSNFFFLKILKKADSVKPYVFYCAATVLSLYTIQLSVLMWLVHNLVFFYRQEHNRKKWIIAQTAIFAIFLLWCVPFAFFIIRIKDAIPTWESGWIPPLSIRSLMSFFKTIVCSGIYFGAGNLENLRISFFQAAQMWLFFTLFILGLGSGNFKKSESLLLSLWVWLPLGGFLLFSLMVIPFFSERYFVFVLPGFLILIGAGIDRFKRKLIRFSLVGAIVLLNLPALFYYYGHDQKAHYDDAVELIKQNTKSKAGVNIVIDSCPPALVFAYYWEKNANAPERFSLDIRRELSYKMYEGGIVYKGRGYNLIIVKDEKQIIELADRGLLSSLPEVWLVSQVDNGVKYRLSSFFGHSAAYAAEGVELYCYNR